MSNGYEIRLELLKIAKDVLLQRYIEDSHRARLTDHSGGDSAYPVAPTMASIIAEARLLNCFINQKN